MKFIVIILFINCPELWNDCGPNSVIFPLSTVVHLLVFLLPLLECLLPILWRCIVSSYSYAIKVQESLRGLAFFLNSVCWWNVSYDAIPRHNEQWISDILHHVEESLLWQAVQANEEYAARGKSPLKLHDRPSIVRVGSKAEKGMWRQVAALPRLSGMEASTTLSLIFN